MNSIHPLYLPFFVGASFVWLGASALRRGKTFNEVVEEEDEKQEQAIQKPKRARNKNG